MMKNQFRTHLWSWLAIFSLLAVVAWPILSVRADDFTPPPSEVAVKLKPNVNIATILARYNASQIGQLTETNLYFLNLNGQDAASLLPTMNSDPDLYYAEPNYYADNVSGEARYIGGHIAFFDASARYIGGHTYTDADARYIGGHEGTVPAPSGDPNWAWQRVSLDNASRISNGQGVIVAVLDTGLAADHSLLDSSLVAGYDFVAMQARILDQGNGLDDDNDGLVDEQTGHGTHVAGIILSAAPGVQVMPIRVLNSDGIGTYWEVAAGIRYAVDHGARVINMSLSAPLLPQSLESALAYAAAHNVLIVAAAGDGDGPNYPAAYANPLAVLGVGATDLDDTATWFSGGLPEHTDLYAPGLNIYSSFPYNQYAYASGTSMAAPIIAGEAALLISRHPEWSAEQIAQRILNTSDTISNSSKRANIEAALNTGLEVQYKVGDVGQTNNSMIAPRMLLINNTPENIPLNQLTLRYWYTVDGTRPQALTCDYISLSSCTAVTGQFGSLASPSPNADTYAQIGFNAAAGNLPAGAMMEILVHFNKDTWANYIEMGDYSYAAGQADFWLAPQIGVYRNGVLVWGIEPVGNPPTPTSMPTTTLMPATATSQPPSPTPAPSATPTRNPVLVIYDEATTWENWSWNAALNFNNTNMAHAGSKSLACTYTNGWAGLSLYRASPVNTSGYGQITFWVYANGGGARPLRVYIHNSNGVESSQFSVEVPADQWVRVSVPLSSLGNPVDILRISIQNASANAKAVMYIDELMISP